MIKIFKKVIDQNEYWTLIEELSDDLAIAQRMAELSQDGNEYRAEMSTIGGSEVMEEV
jgi:hypothetical protein